MTWSGTMAPIPLAFVVNFTSQDDNFPAENLLYGNRRWQSAPNAKVATIEVELQFTSSSRISRLEIGNYGSANVRIQVGRSSWPRDREFVTFLPTVFLMTPLESRQETNKTAVRTFDESFFDGKNKLEMWDRVRILCHQPYRRDSPFGLTFVKFNAVDEVINKEPENDEDEERRLFFERLRPEKVESNIKSSPQTQRRLQTSPKTPTETRRAVKSTKKRRFGDEINLSHRATANGRTPDSDSSDAIQNNAKKVNRNDSESEPNLTDGRSLDRAGPSSSDQLNKEKRPLDVLLKDDDRILCPVCSELFPKQQIEIHVNLCLDFTTQTEH